MYGEPYTGIEKALNRVATEYRAIHSGHMNLEDEIIALYEEFTPDLVFCQIQRADVLPLYVIDYMREAGSFVINWTGDVRYPLPQWYIETGKHVSTSLFSNMNDVYTMWENDLDADYLQIGIDPEVFNPHGTKAEDVPPIIFMANNYKENGVPRFPLSEYRVRLVERMIKEFGDDFAVYGNGWEPGISRGDVNSDQHKEASIYRASKIALNVSHFRYKSYSSDRLFRAMASGTCVVSHYFDHYDNISESLPIFVSPSECVKKVRHLLNHEDERKSIATEQTGYALRWHTYDNMVTDILRIYHEKNQV